MKQCETLKLKAVSFTKKDKHCSPLNAWDILRENQWLNCRASSGPSSYQNCSCSLLFHFTEISHLITLQLSREFWAHKNFHFWACLMVSSQLRSLAKRRFKERQRDTVQLLWLCPLWFQTSAEVHVGGRSTPVFLFN